MNPTTNDPDNLTEEQKRFRTTVELASAKIPRFVFRGWHAGSGGYADLNTTTAVTPLAFSHRNTTNRPSPCFYRLSKDYIRGVANMHLRTVRTQRTISSSWAQTLDVALQYAGTGTSSHISILDTSLLPRSNVILLTKQMPPLGISTIGLSHELLAFGIISGPAYQAVSVERFNRLATPLCRSLAGQEEATAVRQILEPLFRDYFRPAVVAHCLAKWKPNHKDVTYLFDLITGYHPQECPMPFLSNWQQDPKVMSLASSCLQTFEASGAALYAAKLIRTLVRQSMKRKQIAARWAKEIKDLKDLRTAINWYPASSISEELHEIKEQDSYSLVARRMGG